MKIELTIKERNLLVDALTDTQWRLRYPGTKGYPSERKNYHKSIQRLKDRIELSLERNAPLKNGEKHD